MQLILHAQLGVRHLCDCSSPAGLQGCVGVNTTHPWFGGHYYTDQCNSGVSIQCPLLIGKRTCEAAFTAVKWLTLGE